MGIESLKKLYFEIEGMERDIEMLTVAGKHYRFWACVNYFVRIEGFTQDLVVSILKKASLYDFISKNTHLLYFDSKMNVSAGGYELFQSLQSFVESMKEVKNELEK